MAKRKTVKDIDAQIERLIEQREVLADELANKVGKKLMEDFDVKSLGDYSSFRERVEYLMYMYGKYRKAIEEAEAKEAKRVSEEEERSRSDLSSDVVSNG